jgi:hypothetical protein
VPCVITFLTRWGATTATYRATKRKDNLYKAESLLGYLTEHYKKGIKTKKG